MSSTSQAANTPLDQMTFETALRELEGIVSKLEQGDIDLEDSIVLYERGQALKSYCEQKLRSAESRLEKIVTGPKGFQGVEPMDST